MPIERLRADDLRNLLEFLCELYALRDLDTLTAHVNARLPQLVACDTIAYSEINAARQRINYVVEPASASFPGARDAFAEHVGEHPIIRCHQVTGRHDVLKLSDFLTSRQLHRLGLYQEFFRRVDVEHLIVAPLPFRPPLQLGFALCRRSRDFSERDRSVLTLTAPHLAQAYKNAESASLMLDEARTLHDALAATDRGILTLGPDNRVRDMSEQARKWIDRYWGVRRHGSKDLPGPLRQWLIEQDHGIATRGAHLGQPRRPLVVERDGARLVMRSFLGTTHRLVLMEEQPARPSASTLASFGLTRRETQILAWVAEGKTNAEIAGILDIRARTVGKHLEHVFVKLGVETRTAAARMALTALRG